MEWLCAPEPVPYPTALTFMESRVNQIIEGSASECVWLLEHPPIYTAGTSAKPQDFLNPHCGIPIHPSGRGGKFTYHGPGQRVVYLMLDLRQRGADLHRYVRSLEQWLIATLESLGVPAINLETDEANLKTGVWVRASDPTRQADKIAAIGIRVRKWVAYHGVAINVNPDLNHYRNIIPCGITNQGDFGVTSLHQLGHHITMAELDQALHQSFSTFIARLI